MKIAHKIKANLGFFKAYFTEAEAVALKGDAEAFVIEVKAKAEAEQMAKKADAWKEYKEAAMVDMMLQTLPKVRRQAALKLVKGPCTAQWLKHWTFQFCSNYEN